MASHRTWAAAAAVAAVALACSRTASADPYELGGFFGPRFFSDSSSLGAKGDVQHTTLQTSVALGPRLSRPILSWLVPEIELPFAAATTREHDTDVFWIEPRLHARFVWPMSNVRPFAVLGFGTPMTASEHRGIFGSDITWDAYSGIGAMYSPGRGISFRADVRVGITDGFGEDTPIAAELEATLGLFFELDGTRARRRSKKEVLAKPGDQDGDGIVDEQDACPDRPEDEDGVKDTDGCPDIDDDGDQVLDIADACPAVAETFNGFEDDDGCADTPPGDVTAILGTIEGLLYNPGSTEVPSTAHAALDKIVEVMKKFPSVQVVIIGHTDDREAEIEVIEEEAPEDTAQRQADALTDLGRARAEAVADELVERGVGRGRVKLASKGGEDPVSDNDTPRKRLRNRRVELQLYTPTRE